MRRMLMLAGWLPRFVRASRTVLLLEFYILCIVLFLFQSVVYGVNLNFNSINLRHSFLFSLLRKQ